MPLTVCPLSNVKLRVFPDLADHPLRTAARRRRSASTVNSDDPAYFGGYVGENYAAVAQAFSLTEDDLAGLAQASLAAAFSR